jgi:hypothetical protein
VSPELRSVRPICATSMNSLCHRNQRGSSREGPVREEALWVDLASTCQLDQPPSFVGMKGDKKLGFGKERLGFEDKK